MTSLSPHKATIAVLLLICALAAALKIGYIGLTPNSDYDGYVATAKLFAGQHAEIVPARILKPLGPLFVTATAPLAGYANAFVFETVLFYFAFAIAIYLLFAEFFENRNLGLLAALLAVLSYPLLRYGVDLYTETGALFFYILSLYLTLRYIKVPSPNLLIANALVIGIGLLWKEYSVVNGLIFGLTLLFERVEWRTKINNLVLLALLSLAPTLLVQVRVDTLYHYTFLNWYHAGGAAGFATQWTAVNLIKSTAALLGLAWLLVPFGIWNFDKLKSWQQRFLLVSIFPPMIAFAWGYVSSRLFYVMAPALIVLAVIALSRLPRSLQYPLVALIIIANLAWLVISTHV